MSWFKFTYLRYGSGAKDPTLEVSASSYDLYGGDNTLTVPLTYNGNGEITVSSSNTSVATVTYNNGNIVITYIVTGSVTITVHASKTAKFKEKQITFGVNCSRSTTTMTVSKTTMSIAGGTGSGTFTYTCNGDGTISVTSSNTNVATVSRSGTTITVTYKTAGSATITVSMADGTKYAATSKTCAVTCSKSNPTYTAPTAKSLTYTRTNASTITAQALLNAGTITSGHGTIQYSSNNSSWSTTIPTGTTAKTYTVYWRIVGNAKYNDKASASISATIAKRKLNIPALTTSAFNNTSIGSHSVTSNSNYNSVYMTTGGTWSATTIGTYSVSWSLRDTGSCTWSDNTTAAKSASWTCTYYSYNRGASKDSSWNGASITFKGHKGAGSGNYCYYEGNEGSADMMMENKGGSQTDKYITLALNSTIPSGKTIYVWVNQAKYSSYTNATFRLQVQTSSGGSYSTVGTWSYPNTTVSYKATSNVTGIRLYPSGQSYTYIYAVYAR